MSTSDQRFLSQHGGKLRLAAIALLVVSVMLLMSALPFDVLMKALEREVAELGVWGPVVFGLVYVVATVLLIPASLLTLGAGVIFGLGVGLVTVSLASTTGAACAFLIARYLARSKVQTMAESNEKFGAIDAAISDGGWKIVAMLRLSPAIPFGLQNYLYGLTSIRFVPYVLTSWIAMLPGTLLYVYLGLAAKTAAGGREGTSAAQWALLAVGLLATIGVTVYVTRLARRKLAERSDGERADVTVEARVEQVAGPTAASVLKIAAAAVLVLAVALFARSRSEEISTAVEQWVDIEVSDADTSSTGS